MKELFYILLAVALVAGASLAAGTALLRRLRVHLARSEELFLGFLTGASLLSLLIFGLAAVHLAYKGVFFAVAGLVIGAGLLLGRPKPQHVTLPRLAVPWRIVFWALYCVYAAIYLPNALAPEVSPDGTAYHVGLIAQDYRVHSFQWLTTSMYADLSQGLEMLFLWAYGLSVALGRGSAAAMVHLSFLLALPLGMLSYARRFGIPTAGVVAGLLVFMSPVIGRSGTSAYNDIAVAAILFGVFYVLQIWTTERDVKLLIPAGLLAGFGYAVKYTAFLAVPFAIGFVVLHLRQDRRAALRASLVIAAFAAVMIAPWMIKNAVVVSNPLAPFANDAFRNPYIHVSFEHEYRHLMAHFNDVTYAELPLELCIRGGRLTGLLGPVFLLLPLGLFALRHPQGRPLLAAAAVFGLAYFGNLGTRFLIPALPFLSLALAVALSYWKGMGPAVLVAHGILSWPGVVPLYCAQYAWTISQAPWKAAFLRPDDVGYLNANMGDSYEMSVLVNKTVPENQPVFALSSFPRAYVDRNIIVGYESAFGQRMSEAIAAAEYASHGPARRRDYRFAARAIDRIRLAEESSSRSDSWSIHELRFFRNGRELPRSPRWRLRAWPNPWDVTLAFDNNPVTRWSSWEFYRPGMYVDVDFGASSEVDEAVVVCEPVPNMPRLKLETPAAAGGWATLDAAESSTIVPVPPRLRRAAIEYLKGSGLRWMMINITDWAAKDLFLNRAQWGITAAVNTREHVLYHLD